MLFKIINTLRKIINIIYSWIIRKGFSKIGKNFRIEYPAYLIGGNYIHIGNNFNANARLRLEAIDQHNGYSFHPQLMIGDNVSLNYDCHIGCTNKIIIGNGVLIASKVYISDHFHGKIDKDNLSIPPSFRQLYSKGPVIIEDNVWIGEGVAIMPNVTIGKNSIIGANAVVTRSFPKNSIIGGIPAKLIKVIEDN